MKGTKRYRRHIVATVAGLGAAATFAGFAIAAPTPTTIPIPRAESQPEGITLGADGALWFADFGSQAIGRTTAGPGSAQLVPNDGPLPGGPLVDVSGPADITTGPDGNVWFTAFNGTVGKVTGALITGFTVSASPTANLRGIASAGGSLWVLEAENDNLYSVSTGGTPSAPISLVAAGVTGTPEAITAGPAGDANVYFTTSTGVIGKRGTGGGAITTTSVGAKSDGITVGPDNNIWATSGGPGGAGQVNKISTALALLQSFTLPVNAQPHGIVTGPDGALWVAETGTDSVARVSTTGEVTQVPLTGCDAPTDIAVGADKALWVTCFGVAAGPGGIPAAVPGKALVRIVTDAGTVNPPPAPPPPGVNPPIVNLKGGFSFAKGKVFAGKLFTVKVNFNKAVTKSRVRVQIKSVNTRARGAIKSYKTIGSKLVTGKKASLRVKIAKPGAFLLRITFKNGTKTVNTKAVKVTAKRAVVRR